MHLSSRAMKKLRGYAWPGNVRELENAIERAVVLSNHDSIEPDDLVFHAVDLVNAVGVQETDSTLTFHDSVDQYKRCIIQRALERTGGSRVRAAELLGLHPTYLSRLLKQLDIS
jgi:DNA-binding NtrC family response regulator